MTKKNFIALADFLRARTLTPNNGGTFTPYQIEQLADTPPGQEVANGRRWRRQFQFEFAYAFFRCHDRDVLCDVRGRRMQRSPLPSRADTM